jgi:guanosine-3',5'-bis(diphosphate) 3'-pyrophosphohydrolase
MPSDEDRARAFAIAAHGDQRYGSEPYVVHLAAVRQVLRDFDYDGDFALAAWLHDTVEDTAVTVEQLEYEFGQRVAALVWAVTGVGNNRKERSASAYAKMRALPDAVTVKLADRIANSEASARGNPRLLAMYREELAGFTATLGEYGDSAMWERLRRALA